MLKWFVVISMLCVLTGCGAQPTFETVDDEVVLSASATVQTVDLKLPLEAAAPTAQSEQGGTLYLCDGYTLTVQTLSGGDLDRTVRQVTGFSSGQLQLIKTKTGNIIRYHTAWTAAGESGDQVARAVILDDGQNHYAVSVMARAVDAGNLQDTWGDLLASVSLRTD